MVSLHQLLHEPPLQDAILLTASNNLHVQVESVQAVGLKGLLAPGQPNTLYVTSALTIQQYPNALPGAIRHLRCECASGLVLVRSDTVPFIPGPVLRSAERGHLCLLLLPSTQPEMIAEAIREALGRRRPSLRTRVSRRLLDAKRQSAAQQWLQHQERRTRRELTELDLVLERPYRIVIAKGWVQDAQRAIERAFSSEPLRSQVHYIRPQDRALVAIAGHPMHSRSSPDMLRILTQVAHTAQHVSIAASGWHFSVRRVHHALRQAQIALAYAESHHLRGVTHYVPSLLHSRIFSRIN